MFDWSVLASVASSLAGIAGSFTALCLGYWRYAAHRRKHEAILEAKRLNDPELVKSFSDIPPPIPALLPPILFAVGLAGAISGAYQGHRAQVLIAAQQQDTLKPRCCPNGCEPGSACNPRRCQCEAEAAKPLPMPIPKSIETLVKLPAPLDARLSERRYWEPRDCKVDECYSAL